MTTLLGGAELPRNGAIQALGGTSGGSGGGGGGSGKDKGKGKDKVTAEQKAARKTLESYRVEGVEHPLISALLSILASAAPATPATPTPPDEVGDGCPLPQLCGVTGDVT